MMYNKDARKIRVPFNEKKKTHLQSWRNAAHFPVKCDVRRYIVISFVKECLTTT